VVIVIFSTTEISEIGRETTRFGKKLRNVHPYMPLPDSMADVARRRQKLRKELPLKRRPETASRNADTGMAVYAGVHREFSRHQSRSGRCAPHVAVLPAEFEPRRGKGIDVRSKNLAVCIPNISEANVIA
jgi:hypothetical protein